MNDFTKSPHVFLIAAPHGFLKKEPLGLAYCAATLQEAGFRVSILTEAYRESLDASEIAAKALKSGAPVVGFSTTSPAFPLACEAIAAIKKEKPDARIIVGGYHPTLVHRAILESYPAIDFTVRGEGEHTLPELVACILERGDPAGIPGISYRTGGTTRVNPGRPPVHDLDSLPFPARNLLPSPGKYRPFFNIVENRFETKASISSSRGCPYNCAFCSIVSFYRDSGLPSWRARSAGNVVGEIEDLARNYGVQHVNFCDDNFLVSRRRAMDIASLLKERGVGISFGFNTRADQIVKLGDHGLKTMKDAGLRAVELGVESGSQSVLDRYDKGVRVETNREAIALLDRCGIKAEIDFILFDPWTTLDELKENLRFFESVIPPNYPFRKLVHTELILNPGSQVQKRFLEAKGEDWESRSHEIVAYEITDARAAGVFAGMETFRLKVRPLLDRIEYRIEEIQRRLRAQEREPSRLKTFLGEALFLLLPVNRMPLKCFKNLLLLWEDEKEASLATNALVQEFTASAEKLVDEFSGLEKKYSDRQ